MCVPTVTDEAVSQPQPCPPPQQDWCDVRGPLHFWPPEKKGLPVGCVLVEKGEPSGVDSRQACCCPPGGRSVRPDVGEREP